MDTPADMLTYGNPDLPEGTADRPLVTFAVFAYNQEQFIREAVEGAFSQTYEPLEIILSDDCSSDRTFEIMQEMAEGYAGPHRVMVRKALKNSGIAEHFNNLIDLASGKIFLCAAGDDISLPDRSYHVVEAFSKHPKAILFESGQMEFHGQAPHVKSRTLACSDTAVLDYRSFSAHNKLPKWSGASRALLVGEIRRFPPLDPTCPTEDTPVLLRSLLLGSVIYFDKALILRRMHASNLSATGFSTVNKHLDIFSQYLRDIEFAGMGLSTEEAINYLRRYFTLMIARRVFARIRQSNTRLASPFIFIFQASLPLTLKLVTLLRLVSGKFRGA